MCHTASTHNNWRIPYISNIDNFHYFLCVYRTFIKTDHIAGYKKKLQKFKKQRFYRSHYLILIQLVKKNYQKMAKNCLLTYLLEFVFSFSLAIYPEVQLLDHNIVLFLIFWGNSTIFSIVVTLMGLPWWLRQ